MIDTPQLSVSMANSIKYGSYKKYLPETIAKISVLLDSYDKIRECIDLPQFITIMYRPIRGDWGRAFNKSRNSPYLVELDVRIPMKDYKLTLLHELVHIEQFHKKRLKETIDNTTLRWKGKKIKCIGVTFERYSNLPWEVEADTRSVEIYDRIYKEL